MKWAIILVLVAGVDGKPSDVEHVQTNQIFGTLERCRAKASELNAYTELPPVDNGLMAQFYSCVAR